MTAPPASRSIRPPDLDAGTRAELRAGGDGQR